MALQLNPVGAAVGSAADKAVIHEAPPHKYVVSAIFERIAFSSFSEYLTPGSSSSTIFLRSATLSLAFIGKRSRVPSSRKYFRSIFSYSSLV